MDIPLIDWKLYWRWGKNRFPSEPFNVKKTCLGLTYVLFLGSFVSITCCTNVAYVPYALINFCICPNQTKVTVSYRACIRCNFARKKYFFIFNQLVVQRGYFLVDRLDKIMVYFDYGLF